MTALLDLDDWALSVFADGGLLYSEPAVALETDGGIQFGRAAAAAARIHPRRINQSYLSRLSADPLAQPFRAARNHADLFYHQLLALASAFPVLSSEPVLVLVRSTTTSEQLGLVLGVAGECGIRVGGFVDRSVAALASLGGVGDRICLEMDVDHSEICRARLGTDAVRSAVREFPGTGLNQVLDGWANVIADHFIRHSRFDPLHAAATEQQLYDAVRGWFGRSEPQTSISIEHQQEVRRVEVQTDALELKLLERITPLLQAVDAGKTLCLGPNAASTPLLSALLRRRGLHPLGVTRESVLRYVEQHVSTLCNVDEVRLYTTLPTMQAGTVDGAARSPVPTLVSRAAAPPAKPSAATSRVIVPGRPTHGLHATIAYPIGGADLPRDALGDDPKAGVTIDVGGRLFTLIEVRN